MTTENSGDVWHISRNGRQHGPYPLAAIIQAVQKNILLRSDLVWRPGWNTWRRADSIAELFPPPTPVQTQRDEAILRHPVDLKANSAPARPGAEVRQAVGATSRDLRRVNLWILVCIATMLIDLAASYLITTQVLKATFQVTFPMLKELVLLSAWCGFYFVLYIYPRSRSERVERYAAMLASITYILATLSLVAIGFISLMSLSSIANATTSSLVIWLSSLAVSVVESAILILGGRRIDGLLRPMISAAQFQKAKIANDKFEQSAL